MKDLPDDEEIKALLKRLNGEDENVLYYSCSNPEVEAGWLFCDGYCPTCQYRYAVYKNR